MRRSWNLSFNWLLRTIVYSVSLVRKLVAFTEWHDDMCTERQREAPCLESGKQIKWPQVMGIKTLIWPSIRPWGHLYDRDGQGGRRTGRHRDRQVDGERETDRQTDRDRETQTDRQTDRGSDRETETETKTDTETDTETETQTETERRRGTETERDLDGQTDRYKGRQICMQTCNQTNRNTARKSHRLHAQLSLLGKTRAPVPHPTSTMESCRPPPDEGRSLRESQTPR